MSGNKPGTIVVDDLPSQCTTLQLFAAFRKYGKILRAWRSHGDQGLVTFANMIDALEAVAQENDRVVNNKKLKVTAAFFNSAEPPRKGWWQCALCRSWNDAAHANMVCTGYMCGLKQHNDGIDAYESQLSSLAFEENYFNNPQTDMQEQYNEAPHDMQQLSQQPGPGMMPQQPQQHSYYPYQPEYQQPQAQPQAQPYEGPVQEDPSMHSGMVSGYMKPSYYAYDMQVPGQYPTSSYPPTVTQRGQRYVEPSPEVMVSPPASKLNSHCVIVSNVPTNITDKTLNKVFSKFSNSSSQPRSWVRPTQQDTPRALAEGQVSFDSMEWAKRAVEGESSREVDGQGIYCTYAEEPFILSVVAEEHDQWNAIIDNEASGSDFMNELGSIFRAYGLVNAILSHERVVFVEYYSLASALDAICGEDGETRMNLKLQVAFARGGTRWPCACMKVNSPASTVCESCSAHRAPANARLLRDNIHKYVAGVSQPYYGDSYRGYGTDMKGYVGTKVLSPEEVPHTKVNRMEEQSMNGHQPSWKGGGHRPAQAWGGKGGRGGSPSGFQRQYRGDSYNTYNRSYGNGNRMPQGNAYRNDGRK